MTVKVKGLKAGFPWLAGLAGAGVLVCLNVLLYFRGEAFMDKLGFKRLHAPASPTAALSLDDQARFWAYAAYDQAKLKVRFGVGDDAIVDSANAEHHLAHLLSLGVGAAVKREIDALRGGGVPTEKRESSL